VKAYHLDLEGMKGGKDRFESDALVQVLINAVIAEVESSEKAVRFRDLS